ncbi:MAG: glycosyltransferase family 39 protein, partial [Bacteroidota bacterium]
MQNKSSLFWFLIAGFLLFLGIGDMPLYILDEAKNAECAREMWARQDLIVPTFNEALRTDKPPLHYFFMMLAYSLFEPSAFSARCFSALMGLLTLFAVYYYTKQFLNRAAAKWSVLVLLASLHFLFQFHLAVPDPYLIACITVAVFAFYAAIVSSPKAQVQASVTGSKDEHQYLSLSPKRQLFIAYTATAFGTLAKGPVALGLIGLIMLLYLVLTRRLTWQQLGRLRIPLGATWFCLLVLPWYIAVGRATNGEWLEGFFFTHNFNRFTDAMENHGGGVWMTFLYVFAGMLPFILLLPSALKNIYQTHYPIFRQGGASKNHSTSFLLLVLLAASVIIGFFAVSTTKLPNYTVPAYPFLAVILGYYLSETKTSSLIALLIHGLIALALPLVVYFSIGTYELLAGFKYLAYFLLPMLFGAIVGIVFHFKKFVQASWYSVLIGNILTA